MASVKYRSEPGLLVVYSYSKKKLLSFEGRRKSREESEVMSGSGSSGLLTDVHPYWKHVKVKLESEPHKSPRARQKEAESKCMKECKATCKQVTFGAPKMRTNPVGRPAEGTTRRKNRPKKVGYNKQSGRVVYQRLDGSLLEYLWPNGRKGKRHTRAVPTSDLAKTMSPAERRRRRDFDRERLVGGRKRTGKRKEAEVRATEKHKRAAARKEKSKSSKKKKKKTTSTTNKRPKSGSYVVPRNLVMPPSPSAREIVKSALRSVQGRKKGTTQVKLSTIQKQIMRSYGRAPTKAYVLHVMNK